jgi:hypothetical protein
MSDKGRFITAATVQLMTAAGLVTLVAYKPTRAVTVDPKGVMESGDIVVITAAWILMVGAIITWIAAFVMKVEWVRDPDEEAPAEVRAEPTRRFGPDDTVSLDEHVATAPGMRRANLELAE